MNTQQTRKLVLAALFAALSCILTLIVQIPSAMNGYLNLGDCAVLLSGWLLGPVWGAAAAGIGSMMADVFSGYAYYAPGTLFIKAATAAVAGVLYRRLRRGSAGIHPIARVCSAAAGETVMVLGYLGYAALLLGNGLAAAASIPGNLVQGGFGILTSVTAITLLSGSSARIKDLEN